MLSLKFLFYLIQPLIIFKRKSPKTKFHMKQIIRNIGHRLFQKQTSVNIDE